jgi:hypothetical protein
MEMGTQMSRTIYADARKTLDDLDSKLGDLMDVAKVPGNSPLDNKIQAAMNQLYEAIYDLPKVAGNVAALRSRVVVYPVAGRDMRYWFTSDRRRAQSLLGHRRASRVASAAKVEPPSEMQPWRPITARQYLKLFDESIVTERSSDSTEYEYQQSYKN